MVPVPCVENGMPLLLQQPPGKTAGDVWNLARNESYTRTEIFKSCQELNYRGRVLLWT
jgi:hypothetical protein